MPHRRIVDNSDARDTRRLLRARCKRPCRRRAAEKADELAPSWLIEWHPTPNGPGSQCRIPPPRGAVRGNGADFQPVFRWQIAPDLLRVKNVPTAMSALSPFYPELRTLVGAAGRSLVCHKETHALQQKIRSLDHLVGGGEQCRR